MTSYTRHGKQILLDGKHMADAVDETCAMMILNALRALEMASERWEPPVGAPPKLIAYPNAPKWATHLQHREGDEYACSCGLRWWVGEDDPH